MIWAHLADGRWLTAETSHTLGDGYHITRLGRRRKNRIDIIRQDLKEIGMSRGGLTNSFEKRIMLKMNLKYYA